MVMHRSAAAASSQAHRPMTPAARARQRAFCIAALPRGRGPRELGELLRTAGVAVVGEMVQRREQPHPNTYLGPASSRS
jgi:GTP-binding protein HflX